MSHDDEDEHEAPDQGLERVEHGVHHEPQVAKELDVADDAHNEKDPHNQEHREVHVLEHVADDDFDQRSADNEDVEEVPQKPAPNVEAVQPGSTGARAQRCVCWRLPIEKQLPQLVAMSAQLEMVPFAWVLSQSP